MLFPSINVSDPKTCPGLTPAKNRCLASVSRYRPNRRRQRAYCLSDRFDDCPLLLARLLRHGHPLPAAEEAVPGVDWR